MAGGHVFLPSQKKRSRPVTLTHRVVDFSEFHLAIPTPSGPCNQGSVVESYRMVVSEDFGAWGPENGDPGRACFAIGVLVYSCPSQSRETTTSGCSKLTPMAGGALSYVAKMLGPDGRSLPSLRLGWMVIMNASRSNAFQVSE